LSASLGNELSLAFVGLISDRGSGGQAASCTTSETGGACSVSHKTEDAIDDVCIHVLTSTTVFLTSSTTLMPIYPFRPRFLTPPTERTETDNTTIQSSTNLSKFWDMRCAEILDEDTVFDRSAYGFFAPPRLVSQLIPNSSTNAFSIFQHHGVVQDPSCAQHYVKRGHSMVVSANGYLVNGIWPLTRRYDRHGCG